MTINRQKILTLGSPEIWPLLAQRIYARQLERPFRLRTERGRGPKVEIKHEH